MPELTSHAFKNIIGLVEDAISLADRLDDDAADTFEMLQKTLASARLDMALLKEKERQTPPPTNLGSIAFWSYDLFPYVLSGKITGRNTDGTYEVNNEHGYRYSPKVILAPSVGEPIAAALNQLRFERDQANAELHENFMRKVKEACPMFDEIRGS